MADPRTAGRSASRYCWGNDRASLDGDTVQPVTDYWTPGALITRREVLGFEPTETVDRSADWFGRSWLDVEVRVVEDNRDALVIYLDTGTPFDFPDGPWPAPDGLHPWLGRPGWEGYGCLMLQRPGEHHAVWHFWEGEARSFSHWYINIQTAFRRSAKTLDTQDLELDLVVAPDGSWEMKDWDAMDDRVADGRFSKELSAWVRRLGTELGDRLDRGDHWWDKDWADWKPPATWA